MKNKILKIIEKVQKIKGIKAIDKSKEIKIDLVPSVESGTKSIEKVLPLNERIISINGKLVREIRNIEEGTTKLKPIE